MLGLGTSLGRGGYSEKPFLLDEVSNAKLAYSLRKIKSSYTGPAIRVRRESDDMEKDIYFNGRALDIAALEDFADGGVCRVSRWYNQIENTATPILNTPGHGGADLGLSLRKIDKQYTGKCISVRGSQGIVGTEYTAAKDNASTFNQRVVTRTNTFFASAETSTNSLEVWVDAPSQGDSQIQVGLRFGYKSQTVGERGMQFYPNVNQRKWTKISFDASTASGAADTQVFGQRIEAWLGGQGNYQAGDKILIRNANMTAPSFVAPTYDETATGWQEVSDRAKIILSYDVGFDANGNLDTDKIDDFSKASQDYVLKWEADGDVGDSAQQVGIRKTGLPTPSEAGAFTLTAEIFPVCPSVSGDLTVGCQVGANTVGTPVSCPQDEWTTITFQKDSSPVADTYFSLYFAGTGPAPTRTLEDGDVIYMRNLNAKHTKADGYLSDFRSDVDGVAIYSVIGSGSSENSEVTLSHVLKQFDLDTNKFFKADVSVAKWYDQAGGDNDAEQDTYSKMPRIFKFLSGKNQGGPQAAGYAMIEENDKPALEFDGSNDVLETDLIPSLETTILLTSTFGASTAGSAVVIGARDSTNARSYLGYISAGTKGFWGVGDDYEQFAGPTLSVGEQASLYLAVDGTVSGATVSTSAQATDNPADTEGEVTGTAGINLTQNTTQGYYIGALNGSGTASSHFNGTVQEAIVYDTRKSTANRNSLRKNLNDYYRIYSFNDLSQTTHIRQGLITDSSGNVLKDDDDQPYVNLNNAAYDTSESESSPFTMYAVVQHNNGYQRLVQGGTFWSPRANPNIQRMSNGLGGNFEGELRIRYNQKHVFGVTVETSPSRSELRFDGAFDASTDSAVGSIQQPARIMTGVDSVITSGSPRAYEFILFDTSKTSDHILIEENLGREYNPTHIHPIDLAGHGGNAVGAFGLRRLKTTYNGPAIRVRKDDGDAGTTDLEVNIYFDAFGNLDTKSLLDFIGSDNGRVVTWYDQTGRGNHGTQPIASRQPYIVTSGTLEKSRNRPAVRYESENNMSFKHDDFIGQSVFDLYTVTDTTDETFILFNGTLGGGGGKYTYLAHSDVYDRYRKIIGGSWATASTRLYVDKIDKPNSPSTAGTRRKDISEYFLGRHLIVQENVTTSSWTDFHFNGYNQNGSGLSFVGKVQEMFMFNTTSNSANRDALEDNINEYYRFDRDPYFLNTSPRESDCVGAYSLRRVNRNASVSRCINIQKTGSSELQVGFDEFDNLDIKKIEDYADGSACWVTKWWDQGHKDNSHHFTSAGESSAPWITDSNGKVYHRNGRPMLYFDGDASLDADYDGIKDQDRFDAYIVYESSDENYILFAGTTSQGDYSFVMGPRSQNDPAEAGAVLWNDYGTSPKLYINGVQADATQGTDSRFDLALQAAKSRMVIEVHEDAHTDGWSDFHFSKYGSRKLTGYVGEIMLFNDDMSSYRDDIVENMNDYYLAYRDFYGRTLNEGTLDKQTSGSRTAPKYAYSLRKLDKDFTGAPIRVRRESDDEEKDIPFTPEGELDIPYLEMFCGSDEGYVVTWYDQSGNDNDMSQSTDSLQGKIVDDSGDALVDDEGRAYVDCRAAKYFSPVSVSTGYTAIAIAMTGNSGRLLQGGGPIWRRDNTNSSILFAAGSTIESSNVTVEPDEFAVFSVISNGSSSRLRFHSPSSNKTSVANISDVATGNAGTNGISGTTNIFTQSTSGTPDSGVARAYEMVIFDRVLEDSFLYDYEQDARDFYLIY